MQKPGDTPVNHHRENNQIEEVHTNGSQRLAMHLASQRPHQNRSPD